MADQINKNIQRRAVYWGNHTSTLHRLNAPKGIVEHDNDILNTILKNMLM